ncbi:squalene/phytoene synthase family protein [Hyphococcus sp.]|uniref:squalene/phytoene synthase family protein n=1 Tax=Hyphococcus sp. TaxID=2038636 RepID=UPI003CCC1788
MTDAQPSSAQYCSNLVRARDDDRWLAAGYAPQPLQRILLALYAMHAELRRVPQAVSEPPLGEIRLQWWRDAIGEIRAGKPSRAHPVVEEIAAAGLADQKYEALLERAIDANARPLYGASFSSVEELETWCADADGAIDAVGVLALQGSEALADTARRAGAGFAMAREGCTIAPQLGDISSARAMQIARAEARALNDAPASVSPAILHLSLTGKYARGPGALFAATKRLRMFRAMAFGAY